MLSCRIQHIIMRQLRITKQITVKESKSVEAYLQEISKLPLITAGNLPISIDFSQIVDIRVAILPVPLWNCV